MIGVGTMLVCGHFFGQLAGVLILIRKWNYVLTGWLIGMAVIWTTTFIASWTGFIREGIDNIGSADDPFVDYIFKPMFWVTFMGFLPVLAVGLWLDKQIWDNGNAIQ